MQRDVVQLVLVVVAFFVYITAVICSYFNQPGSDEDPNNSSIGSAAARYYDEATPRPLAFIIIWPIIYLWNLVGIVYIVVSCFLPQEKSPVNFRPTLIPKSFLVGHILAFAAGTGWLFAYEREILGLALALLIIFQLSVYFAVGTSYKVVTSNATKLEADHKVMLWMMRILIQNGLCLLATWLTVATLLNLTDVILYEDSFGKTPVTWRGTISVINGSTIPLVILMVYVIAWFVTENFVFEKYCRYTYTVYPVLILALSGIIDKLSAKKDSYQNLIIASVNLGLVLLALIARITLALCRNKSASFLV